MLLRSVTVQNFRGLEDVTVELGESTVLIGENNSGKTSVLDAVRLCLSRSLSRRTGLFEDHDYYLRSNTSRPGDAGTLRITLDFAEERPDEWDAELQRSLGDMIAIHAESQGDIRHVTLQVESHFEKTEGDFVVEWNFLDAAGNVNRKAARPINLSTLQQLKPVFYLAALRDAATQFQPRSAFWAPFLRNPSIPAEDQAELEAELRKLNDKILSSEARLRHVKDNLAKAQHIVALGQKDTVSIEALPTRVWEMLSRAHVNVAGASGASIPLARHGSGTQSLSVIFLFQAFLESGLGQLDKLATPILALEEPEAHLHPAAIRALWSTVESLKGQKIIATHSGDLLSQVPLASIRRFHRVGGKVVVRRLRANTLTDEELRKVNFHVRRTRGELLFARCWLLGEGETEYWVLSEAASILGIDLERAGVRIVDSYSQSGVIPFAKLADDLGIEWLAICDGDAAGQGHEQNLKGILGKRREADHIAALPQDNMELFLCSSGYGKVYTDHISPQKKQNLTAKPGDKDYWRQVLKCQERVAKSVRALEVMDEIRKSGKKAMPRFLVEALKKSCELASK
jgi:putative ATP-dependent endonuclease of the OLD family